MQKVQPRIVFACGHDNLIPDRHQLCRRILSVCLQSYVHAGELELQRHPFDALERITFNLIQIERDPRQASRWSCCLLPLIR